MLLSIIDVSYLVVETAGPRDGCPRVGRFALDEDDIGTRLAEGVAGASHFHKPGEGLYNL